MKGKRSGTLHGKILLVFSKLIPHLSRWILGTRFMETERKDRLIREINSLSRVLWDVYQREVGKIPITSDQQKQYCQTFPQNVRCKQKPTV